jgi:hypothetical protein
LDELHQTVNKFISPLKTSPDVMIMRKADNRVNMGKALDTLGKPSRSVYQCFVS